VSEECWREWREGRECGGRRSGGEVGRLVETCGRKMKTIDVNKVRQKIVVRAFKEKKKKLPPISNIKMITIQHKKSWYVVLKKN